MRQRRNVFNRFDFQSGGLERRDRAFATAAGSTHFNVDFFHPAFDSLFSSLSRRQLAGERGALATTLETAGAGTCPTNHVAFCVGDGDRGVIERGPDVRDAHGNVSAHLAALFCISRQE